jgi:hypothetical protein
MGRDAGGVQGLSALREMYVGKAMGEACVFLMYVLQSEIRGWMSKWLNN